MNSTSRYPAVRAHRRKWLLISIIMSRGARYVGNNVNTRLFNVCYKCFRQRGPWNLSSGIYLGDLPKPKNSNKYLVKIKDGFSKLIREILTKTTAATVVGESFVEQCNIPYGSPEQMLEVNGAQVVGKLFSTPCVLLRTKLKTPTAPYTQTNRHHES